MRFHFADTSAPQVFESHGGTKVEFQGVIIDEPDVRENNQKLTVAVNQDNQKTDILVTTDLDISYRYGDKIDFSGKLTKPENFMTDQGNNFDYVDYLRKDGIFYLVNYPQINILLDANGLPAQAGNPIKSILFAAKEKFLALINYEIPAPESLLMGGFILGERSQFDQTLKQNLVNTGTIHIVALDGYKVTLVSQWLVKIFTDIPYVTKNLGLGMGIFSIILFVIMTGGSATAVRAGIMATLALCATMTGRNYDVARALAITAVVMILFNPFVLAYDASFQFSFLGTIAVVFIYPRI